MQRARQEKLERQENLKTILDAHADWLEDGAVEARPGRADLSGANCSGLDFAFANLRKVCAQNADFKGANLSSASLVEADFSGADLREANLIGCDLRDATFQNADLENASLTQTRNLTQQQLGGANLDNTHLDDTVKIDATTQVDEALKNAGKLHLGLLLLCIFSVLVVLSTSHQSIVLDSGQAKLPIIDIPIPIAWFFWLTPLLILLTSITFQVHLTRAWAAMAELPATFPDGKSVYRKVHPLQINSVILQHWPRLQQKQEPLSSLVALMGKATIYLAAPAAILFFLKTYFVKQSLNAVVWHTLLLIMALTSSLYLWRLGLLPLQPKPFAPPHRNSGANANANAQANLGHWLSRFVAFRKFVKRLFLGVLCVLLPLLALGWYKLALVVYVPDDLLMGTPSNWRFSQTVLYTCKGILQRRLPLLPIHAPAQIMRSSITADLSDTDLTARPEKWIPRPESDLEMRAAGSSQNASSKQTEAQKQAAKDWSQYKAQFDAIRKPVQLRFASLHYAYLDRAFLVKADLTRAELYKASLVEAHLAHATLDYARLWEADFTNADLSDASLMEAELQRVKLNNAHLEGAHMEGAHLEGAELYKAHLKGSHLEDAYLKGALLEGAELNSAHMEGAHLENAELSTAHLAGANLEGANLKGANLKGATYTVNANYPRQGPPPTRWPEGYDFKRAGAVPIGGSASHN